MAAEAHDHNLFGERPPSAMRRTEGVTWLYYSRYYDGPLNGRVLVDGEELWAEAFEECGEPPCGWYRRYQLIRLTPEAAAEEARRQALFEEHVGTHWNRREGRKIGEVRPEAQRRRFYDEEKTWPKWEPEGDLVGWFEI